MGAAVKFKQSDVARQTGELARLKVVRGPDQGAVFVITGSRVTVGRGEDNEVVLSDLRASRRHLEIVQGATPGSWIVNDLGSANGIAWNGRPVRNAPVRSKDTIGLGETVLEFASIEAGTMVLQAPPITPEQLQKEQMGLAVQKAKVHAMSRFGGLANNVPRIDEAAKNMASTRVLKQFQELGKAQIAGGKKKKGGLDPKILLIGAVAVGLILMLMGGNGDKSAPKSPGDASSAAGKGKGKPGEAEAARNLSSYLPTAESPQVERTAEMFYRTGFREYRQGNWVRARTQFETVLQMAPAHQLARLYLEDCKLEIEHEVKEHIEQGTKSFQSGKLKDARGHFEAVLRLLHRDPGSQDYVQAREALAKVNQAMAAPDDGGGG